MKTPIYMDNHATTSVDPRVLETMLPYFSDTFGNSASRNHSFGWQAEEAVENARGQIARLIGADAREIIITSGATESDNLALTGVAEFYKEKGNHIITCVIEHKAILDTGHMLEQKGFEVTFLPVDKHGSIDLDELADAITDKTTLVSLMAANNEIGTLNPLKEIGKLTREKGVLFHCDATQGVGHMDIDVEEMNIDLASFTAHKIYGPKGVGALYVRRRKPRVRLSPLIYGGGHERGMRSGTLNVPGIVGFGKAADIMHEEGAQERENLLVLRERIFQGITREVEYVYLNGHPDTRHPGNVNLSFAYVEGESLLMGLSDIAVSSGSACTSASLEPSYVLRALGVGDDLAHSSIRFGVGRFNTEEEVDYVILRVVEAVSRLREMSPLYEMAQEGIDPSSINWSAH
ncbi:MAG: IscS subfamily cysteine desulfurase [SAR324 cluster bacterium]|nr:IscS subfamily cysteine desulfurase [SAR324 cluster bacterium]MCZ6645667.1 IscS subfamily cysteine desulfurase [SAR324 cluster bacterium]